MIHWALIGYGGMGSWHVRNLRMIPETVQICGIYDISEDRQKAAAENGLNVYPSLEALLADEQVELVTLAVPNHLHRPLAIRCMEAGKNVISEKPVAVTTDELRDMIRVSRETGKLFTVHQNRRFDEDFLSAKKIYDENMLGHVFNIESRVHGSRGVPGDWRNRREYGGGMILDWGVHLIDQMLQLVPEDVVSVYCREHHVTNEEVDDGFYSCLTFASGLTATIEVGTSNFIALPRWYIEGENGTAVIRDFKMNGEIIKVCDWEKKDAVPVVTAAGLTKTMAPRTADTIQHYDLPRIESDVHDYYRNIDLALQGKAEQLVTHKQMLRVMRVMEAMMRSDENGMIVHERI